MGMTKPDRLSRLVQKAFNDDGDDPSRMRVEQIVLALLHREQARVRRLVKQLEKDCRKVRRIVGKDDVHALGMLDGVRAVLAALRKP